jgi:hypothetical protein
MLGKQEVNCVQGSSGPDSERYKRDLFVDMKIAIDCLKEFNDKLNTLHPEIIYKIRCLI